MALLIKFENFVTSFKRVEPNGETFSLKELQEYVDGPIEIVHVANGVLCMVMNEEGKIRNLPINPTATMLYSVLSAWCNDNIVGNVLICNADEIE